MLSENQLRVLVSERKRLTGTTRVKNRLIAGLAGGWACENWLLFAPLARVRPFLPAGWSDRQTEILWWIVAALLAVGPVAGVVAAQRLADFLATEIWKGWPVWIGWQAFCAARRR